MFHLMVKGSGRTSGAHTIIHEACAALLQGTNPVPRRNSTGIPACLGRRDHLTAAIGFAFCVCVCVRVCVCVSVGVHMYHLG